MNRFEYIGRLVGDPETRYTKDNKEITSFTLAINNTKDDATYVKIITFAGTAKLIKEYTHKGDMILVDGIVKNNNYEDKEGKKHFEYQFIGNKVEFLSRSSKPDSKPQKSNIPDDKVFEEFGKSIEISDSEIAF